MMPHPAQAEEVELAMRKMGMEKSEASAEKQVRDANVPTRNAEHICNTGHGSAYRAAYIKTHNMDL